MAKSKRNVDDFQKAMLANTKKIKSTESNEKATPSSEASIDSVPVSPKTIELLKAFAQKHNLPVEQVAELAIHHFVEMEDFWFKK